MATPNEIARQTRIVQATKNEVANLIDVLGRLDALRRSYGRLGLADDAHLTEEACAAAGTTPAEYRAAIASLDHLERRHLDEGHGTNYERFAR
jgi:hypothetical protein